MHALKEVLYEEVIERNSYCLLVADIGGTNSNFGFFSSTGGILKLLFSLHTKSQHITNFTNLVREVLAYAQQQYGISVMYSCFAAAGVVSSSRDYCRPTNLTITIDARDILAHTALNCALITNDFEVIGHGLSLINPTSIVQVKKGRARVRAAKAIVGAGTGLGKCSLLWSATLRRYMPHVSEGGHADFAPLNAQEYAVVEYINKKEQRTYPVSWEDMLSGSGIQRIYQFFIEQVHGNERPHEEHNLHPDEIFNSRNKSDHCLQAYELYKQIYARCAKNFALDTLALGGVYIAGGIAAKNLELFQQKEFSATFVACQKQKELLEQIPVYVITDYNVSLYGAALFLKLEGLCG